MRFSVMSDIHDNPVPPNLRESYILLEADTSGHRVEQRRAKYYREAVVEELRPLRHPGAVWIIKHMRKLHKCDPEQPG